MKICWDNLEKIRYTEYGNFQTVQYNTFVHQLEPIEQCKRNASNPNIIEVKCTYCGKWYIPNRNDVKCRIQGIKEHDTRRFYCSSSCKQECPIFGRISKYKFQKGYSSREVQPELRQLVFAHDNYTCCKCNNIKSLHCHHIDPVANNPIESADVDNCVTLCENCHKEIHKQTGCKYHELKGCK